MAKDVYYFSHDANARHDPKILGMRSVYGAEGYGWFWILVEMMREADGYKLDMQGKYVFHAYAKQMECKCMEDAQQFITDCIHEFELFGSDGEWFWSNSLLNRMNKREKVKEAKQAAANKRWNKTEGNQGFSGSDDANGMQTQCKTDAYASENDALKESKGKERKVKEDLKDIVPNDTTRTKFIPPLLEEVTAYCKERGKGVDPERWFDHYTANGWMVGKTKMKDWKAAVRTWEKNAKQYPAVQTKQQKNAEQMDVLANFYKEGAASEQAGNGAAIGGYQNGVPALRDK
ncbi:DUF4373 domain-containing protein [Paenibacillus sp. sgz302251]|uniref:DUF4373 domain-containing protein n=1 Tax=Paenibacillus sp. sgz302251 TaxID=3414493 RepID=UPI003C7C77C1